MTDQTADLPQLLADTLTQRYTELGNPGARMDIRFKGPDGWPASRPVSPNDVAAVLRELLAAGVRDAARQASGQQPPAVAYGDGKGRVYCLGCANTVAAAVPLTVDVVDHWEECPSCGRHVVDVARQQPAVGVQDATQPTTDETGPHVRAVEYAVNCLPEDDINANGFEIRVQYRGAGRYAVIRHGEMCLGADGTWDFGVKEYDRGEDWLNAHRFDLDTALRMAREHAPHVTVNGHTVADALRLAAGAES